MTLSTISKPLAAAVVAIAALFATQTAEAAPGDHLDHLARRLQVQSRDLIGEFRLHYRHTQEYPHLMSDAYAMYRLAGHIHTLAHTSSSLHHIESDLARLDRLHHHIHDLVDHREIHPHGGHVHGDTGHVHAQLKQMEDTLHHMIEDVRELKALYHHGGISHGHGHDDVHILPYPNYSSSGFQFRRGGITVRFGH